MFGHHTISREQRVLGDPETVFGFFADAGNLESITPPWLKFHVVTPRPIDMREGALIEYRLTLHGVPGERFVDAQLHGPYALWHHTHEFEADGDGTIVRDTVRYALPLGPLGEIAHAVFVKRDLERIFDYRTVSLPSMPSAR
jgi:ligand-binding SRPBCC domain-containing protein